MKNEVIVFSRDLNKIQELKSFVLKNGHFDFSYFDCCDFEECLSEVKRAKLQCETTFVICKNEQIDKLLQEIVSSGDSMTLIREQAVNLQNGNKDIIFVPIELDFKQFLTLEKREVFVYSLFGKTLAELDEKLCELSKCDSDFGDKFCYKTITKSQLLHTIYTSKPLEVDWLNENFGESLFSQKEESLTDCLANFLKDKNFVLADMTGVTKSFLKSNVFPKTFMLFKEEDFENLGLSKEFLAENGLASRETAYHLAKHILKFGEIALTVLVNDGKSFVAIGNKDEIHVYSFVFEGENFVENFEYFALFEMLKFLQSKEN